MRFWKTLIVATVAMILMCSTAFATPGGASMTPPADYDEMADGYFNIRHLIGYGDIENDPMAHGLTVYNASSTTSASATPELGDSSAPTTILAGLGVVALAGVVIADKKRRALSE